MIDKDKNQERRINWNPVDHYQEMVIAENYDKVRFSSLSGRIFNWLEKRYIKKAFQDNVPKESIILDLPCGTGRLAEVLLENNYKIIGIDASPAMLEVAKQKLKRFGDNFSTSVLDIFQIPPDTKAIYDAALCARVLMHFPLNEQIKFLSGVAQLTKNQIVLTQSLSTPYHQLRRRIKGIFLSSSPEQLIPSITKS